MPAECWGISQGEYVRRRREELGWSQQVLADKCQVHHKTIHRLENARIPNPRLHTLNRLARVLKCSVSALREGVPLSHGSEEFERIFTPKDEPESLTPVDIYVMRQARAVRLNWVRGNNPTHLTCYGSQDIRPHLPGYPLLILTSGSACPDGMPQVNYWWQGAMAFIRWDLDPKAMVEWQNLAGRCEPGDWLYFWWRCDCDTTEEQRLWGLCADTLDVIIQRDGVEMSYSRLITRIEPRDSPHRLFRFEDHSIFQLD